MLGPTRDTEPALDKRQQRTADEIHSYLATGEYDMLHLAWSGENTLDRLNRGHDGLLRALVVEVQRRTGTPDVLAGVQGLDLIAFGRKKAEPMVRGLFSKAEQETMLSLVERAVVLVTPANIESVLMDSRCPSSAWTVANLYLASVDAELLGKDAPRIVGFSEELTCYVSLSYFRQKDPFADFVVHEMAHVFHNCRRHSIGFRETPKRKYPLDIDFRKRETFAYACKAYSRVLERAGRPVERKALAQEFDGFRVDDHRVDSAEVADLVQAACERRNGWRVILAHCAPQE